MDDGVASDGTGRPLRPGAVRRSFSAEYKLAILAEYDACSESGEKGAILRCEGLYSSLITDWRRQHRQGLLKAPVGRYAQPSLEGWLSIRVWEHAVVSSAADRVERAVRSRRAS